MIGRLISLCGTAALLACAPAQHLPEADLTDEHGWIFFSHLRMAAFAAPDPREYSLIVGCAGADALRFIHRTLRPEELEGAVTLTLQSGGHVLTLPGERQEERLTPPPVAPAPVGELTGITVMAVAPLDSPVLRNFLESGELELRSGTRVTQADAAPNETAALHAMWERCT